MVTVDGTTATVLAIQAVPGAARMWDLTVSQVHTFAVGNAQAVVHNCGVLGNDDGVVGDLANKVPGQPNLYYGQAADTFQLVTDGWTMDMEASSVGPMKIGKYGKDFSAFLRSQGKSTSGWFYHMEEWVDEHGERIKNHYWSDQRTNPTNPSYYHHHD